MERLAQAIRIAMKLREDSFTVENFYSIGLYEAADRAASQVGFDTRGTDPIHFLLVNSWNEIGKWADSYDTESTAIDLHLLLP